MRYEGLEPLVPGEPEIEVVTPAGTFDLHNFGSVEAIAFEPPRALSVTVRCWEPERVRVRLRFEGVANLSATEYEDNPHEADTWEHLVVGGDLIELRTGTHELQFGATSMSARVERIFGSAVEPPAFQAAVRDCFASPLGLETVERDGYAVRLQRPGVEFSITYDATRSWELDVWLGRAGDDDRIDLASALDLGPMQTGDPRVLRKLLTRAADALKGCGAELLDEDGAALRRAFALREAQAAEDERTYLSPQVLEEADAAWAGKDLARLVELLGPLRDRLQPRHARRLAFAERRATAD